MASVDVTSMKRTKRTPLGLVVGVILFGLGPLSGCGSEPHGACLVRVGPDIICYEDASALCCQQLLGEFHSEDVCSNYASTQVQPASASGCH
jgi:hypothetical protein